MTTPGEDVYCTLLLSDGYLPGAMVLAHSLRDAGTKKKLAVLVTLDHVDANSIGELKTIYDHVIPVDRITNKSPANLYLMNRGDLGSTFTKINLWRQGQFRKIVYIDADVVALRAPDELFDTEETFAAAPDIGWPDCFNSGVMALSPNMGDYYSLLALAQRGISFDGADQGLLNTHFNNFHRLSFTYNCTPSGNYQYLPAYRHFQSSISMVHFIGANKPWQQGRETSSASPVYEELLGRWWSVYDRHFRVPLTAYISGQSSGGGSRIVQQYVKGETQHLGYGYSSVQPVVEVSKTEEPVHETARELPVQRKFSAPSVEWDPSRSGPPARSKPEAANFPNTTYLMSQDGSLFRAPASYPAPPAGLHYQGSGSPREPEQLKPIFPWESKAQKPVRRFADDDRPSPPPSPGASPGNGSPRSQASPATPTIRVTPSDPWDAYARTNTWDAMPEIDQYVRGLKQFRKGKVQVLHDEEAPDEASPSGRRPSMKLTDFPSEIERPSLPVTPAPVRRPSFWGSERNQEGDLPAAEGVPKQADWNPSEKLDELTRRQSEAIPRILNRENNTSPSHDIPERKLPSSAVPVPATSSSTGEHGAMGGNERKPSTITEDTPAAPAFTSPDFVGNSTSANNDQAAEASREADPLSPITAAV
ncbi:MAG: hypothetical protein M4579_003082 [Chaenotheca gracillima]|nr:MAG: hypothetical protein M4579_003082 [Chaenotheca gracillima]